MKPRQSMTMRIKLLVYFVARTFGLFALCRRMTRSRVRILGYHAGCIGDQSKYNPILFMSAATFRRRIDWMMAKGFNVVTLERAVAIATGRVAHEHPVDLPTVITFDDGWQSTVTQLIPVLAEKNLPSTMYLNTSAFEDAWPIPTVVTNYMVWKSPRRVVDIAGAGAGLDGRYDLDDAASLARFRQGALRWLGRTPATRETVVERMHGLAEMLGLDAVEDVALDTGRFDYLSTPELHRLSESRCAVELHGHHHHYPNGDPEAFAADLAACREVIMRFGLPDPTHYCYPSGNFDSQAEVTLRRLDVKSATTCRPGLVPRDARARRYYLPRLLDAENMHMLEFESEMSGFHDLLRWLAGRK